MVVYGLVYLANYAKLVKFENYLLAEKKRLFYGDILVLLVEGYIEFIITGYLNIGDKSAYDSGLSGEVVSYVLGWFGIIVTLIIIPGLFIMILRQPSSVIDSK